MSDKIVNHFVLADGSVARYDYDGLVNAPNVSERTELTANLSVGTIVTNVNIGAVVDVNTVDTTQTLWRHLVVACNEGDKFTISGGGGGGARLWAFTDTNYKLLSKSGSGATATDLELTATANGYFVYNAQVYWSLPTPKVVVEGVTDVSGRLNDLDTRVSVLTGNIEKIMGYVFNDKYHINPSIPTSYTPMGDYTFPDMSYNPEEFTINDLYTMFDSLGLEKTHPGNDATNTYYVWAYKHPAGKLALNWNEKKSAPTVFVVAGIHGDEKSTCLAVYTMLRNIVNRADPLSCYLADNVNVVVIPCANPWGFMNNSRENSNGVNINRNFPDGWVSSTDSGSAPLSERESINIANTLSENSATMAYVIDYHTTGQIAIVPAINTLAIMTDLAIYPNEQVGYSTLYAGNVTEAYVHELDNAYTSNEVCGQLTTDTPAGSFCRYASSLKYNASLLEVTPRLRNESAPYGELSNKLANKLLLETIRNGLMHQ